MIVRMTVLAALLAASAGAVNAQQSEVLFSHKHWEVSVVGWDDGSVGCVAEVKAPGESFSIWTFPDGAVQLQFYSTAWEFGEGQTADQLSLYAELRHGFLIDMRDDVRDDADAISDACGYCAVNA